MSRTVRFIGLEGRQTYIMTGIATATPGRDREAIELIVQYRDAGSAAHGVLVSAWSVVAGAPWGTVAITSRDEAWNALADDAVGQTLADRPDYPRMVDEAGRLTEPGTGHRMSSLGSRSRTPA